MYKLEVQIDGQFVNNFYNGSIYDLVFLDLEFWTDYVKRKCCKQNIWIYDYSSFQIKQTAIYKNYVLEHKVEEEQLVKEIMKDIDILKNKVFVGFHIKGSDFITLKRRLKALSIDSKNKLKIIDFRLHPKSIEYKGLNGLFKYLEVKVNKKIDGSYFRRNPQKVFARKIGWIEILLNMFEYCLEDAAAYFNIVSNWNKKIPLISKDMIETELLYYSANNKKFA